VQRVIVPAEPEDDGLLGSSLISDDPVGLPFGSGFGLRWSSDSLGEFLASSFGTNVER
jgi:hypothetical protein